MKTEQIEVAIYSNLARKDHKIICPNISWGLGLNHECDILIVDKNNFLTEIEIKVSRGDLVADGKKWHKHKSDHIKYLYFAIPEKLDRPNCIEHIPQDAGIYVVTEYQNFGGVTFRGLKLKRKAKANPKAAAIQPKMMRKLAYLMQFRYWKERGKAVAKKYPDRAKPKNRKQLEINLD